MTATCSRSLLGVLGAALFVAPRVISQDSSSELIDFARALSSRGYSDIAKVVMERAKSAGGTIDMAEVDVGSVEIAVEEAMREKNLAHRVQRLKDAAEKIDGFIKSHGGSPRVPELRLRMSNLYRVAGEQSVAAIKAEPEAVKKEKLREDGINIFGRAEKMMDARLAELTAIINKTEDDQRELMAIQYSQGRLYWSKAQIFEKPDGSAALNAIETAKSILEEFQIDHPGELFTFEGLRLLAQIKLFENKPDDALDHLTEGAASLLEAIAGSANIVEDESVRDTISGVFLDKARLHYFQKKDANEAIRTIELIHKEMPSLITTSDGKAALALLADAYANEGKTDKAKTVATKLRDADPDGVSGGKARDLLVRIMGKGAGGDGLVKALEAAVGVKEFDRADRLFGQILNNPVPGSDTEVTEATFLMGQLYFDTGRPIEAALCFRNITELWPAWPRASMAKLNEAMAFNQAYRIDKHPLWKQRVKEAQADLRSKYPTSVEALDIAMLGAMDLEAEGKLPEAVEQFLRVPTTSPKYGEAQHHAGKHCVTLAIEAWAKTQADDARKRFGMAEQALSTSVTALEILASKTLNEGEGKRLRDMAFNSNLLLSGVYLQTAIKQPQKCIDLLAKIEDKAKDDKAKISKVWDLRIKGYVQMNRGKEAGELLEQFLAQAKARGDSSAGVDAVLSVAAAMDAEALEKHKSDSKGDVTKAPSKEVLALWQDAAKWYRRAVDESAKGASAKQAKSLEMVANRLLTIAAQAMNLSSELPLFQFDDKFRLTERDSIDRAYTAYALVVRNAAASGASEANFDRQRNIARCAAMLGKWTEAVTALKVISDANVLFTREHKLDATVQKQFPALPYLYEDLSVASIRAGTATKQMFYFEVAQGHLNDLIRNADANGRLYWESRYCYLMCLYYMNKFEDLKTVLDSLGRTAPDADGGKFGIKERIDALRTEVEKRVGTK